MKFAHSSAIMSMLFIIEKETSSLFDKRGGSTLADIVER